MSVIPEDKNTGNERKLHINWGACAGRGLCIELLEEKLTADDWGYPYSPEGNNIEIPPQLQNAAQEAVEACPMRALRLL